MESGNPPALNFSTSQLFNIPTPRGRSPALMYTASITFMLAIACSGPVGTAHPTRITLSNIFCNSNGQSRHHSLNGIKLLNSLNSMYFTQIPIGFVSRRRTRRRPARPGSPRAIVTPCARSGPLRGPVEGTQGPVGHDAPLALDSKTSGASRAEPIGTNILPSPGW